MKKEKLLTIAIVALLILNLGTLGFLFMSHGKPPMGRPGGKPVDAIIIEGLKLNENQIAQFEDLKHEHHSQMMRLQETDKNLHETYFALLKTSNPDLKQETNLRQQLANLDQEKDSITFDHFKKLRGICNPEQQQRFDSLIDEILRALHSQRRGPDHPRN